jgi:hypothetical protein
MPPKEDPKKAAAAAPASPGIAVHIELIVQVERSNNVDASFQPLGEPHIRIAASWLECITTENILGGSTSWSVLSYKLDGEEKFVAGQLLSEVEPGALLIAKWERTFDLDVKSHERMQAFHEDPGLYAFVLGREEPKQIPDSDGEAKPPSPKIVKPVGVAYADCSSLLLSGGTIESRSGSSRGVSISTKVTVAEALMSRDEAVALDPFMLSLHTIGEYPIQKGETQHIALDPVYVFGTIRINNTINRKIFSRPTLPADGVELNAALSTQVGQDSMALYHDVPLHFRSCVLPGLGNRGLFRELLSSSTHLLEIHHDTALFTRVMPEAALTEYNEKIQASLSAPSSAAPVAPAGKGGKGAPAASAAVTTQSSAILPPGPIHDSDKYLISCLWVALENGGKILPHGAVRFRLEQLLSSSVDLLKEFEKTRGERPEIDDNTVVVRDDILGEVRLEKPSKPEKWHRPSDISLRGALSRAIEAEAKMKILEAQGMNMNKSKDRPRHEKFLANNTHVVMTAELHRMLKHPEATPSVISDRVRKQVASADDPFTLTTTAQTLNQSMSLRSTFISMKETKTRIPRDLSTSQEISTSVQERLAVTPYTRMVFVFKYTDDETLSAINTAVSAVNLAALPNIQGSLRSYSFSKNEIISANSAELDVICGFTVIDDDARIVVIEGLAGPDKGMQEVFLDLPRLQPNNKALKILCNPEVLFPNRIYTEYGPDIKRIRIRDKLSKLARSPEIYNRNQVDAACFEAIDCVMALRRAMDLKSTKDLNMYPTSESLNKVELLYGEAISRIDLDGAEAEKKRLAALKAKKRAAVAATKDIDGTESVSDKSTKSAKSNKSITLANKDKAKIALTQLETTNELTGSHQRFSRCPPTDCWNKEFEV